MAEQRLQAQVAPRLHLADLLVLPYAINLEVGSALVVHTATVPAATTPAQKRTREALAA